MSCDNAQRFILKYGTRARDVIPAIPHLHPHLFQHTFATTALLNGVDVKTVSSMLWHYSAGFTLDTYTHVTAQMQQVAADKIGGFLENALPVEGSPEPEPPKGKVISLERVG